MKTRILAAAFLVPALFLLVLVLPKVVAAVILGILQAIAAYELLYRTRLVTKPRLVICCAVMAFAIAIWSFYGAIHAYFVLLMLVYFLLMFGEMMKDFFAKLGKRNLIIICNSELKTISILFIRRN